MGYFTVGLESLFNWGPNGSLYWGLIGLFHWGT